jgi:hypothetical protein
MALDYSPERHCQSDFFSKPIKKMGNYIEKNTIRKENQTLKILQTEVD